MQFLMLIGFGMVLVSSIMGYMGYRGRQQVVGIDLGTTFSVAAVKLGGNVTVLPDRFSGKPLVPSVVTFHPNGTVVVGKRAVQLRDHYPKNTIFNAKRFIGRTFNETQGDAASHIYDVAPNATDVTLPEGDRTAGFNLPTPPRNKTVLCMLWRLPWCRTGSLVKEGQEPQIWASAIDVGAAVVKYIGLSIEAYMGYSMSRAVICVPAKFGPEQSAATKAAFEKAGFKVMRVLEEPTAAAVAYNLHKTTSVKHVLVYDIGGGTLDTSLLYMNGQSITLLGVAGDDHLGGSDFDHRMHKLLADRVSATSLVDDGTGLSLQIEHDCDRNGLHILAEDTKIALTYELQVEVGCRTSEGKVQRLAVTRAEFEDASADLFARAIAPVEKVLADQYMEPHHVDDVVLVGGASRTPRIRQLLQEFFGPDKKLHTDIDPDVTVAYGAANILD